MDNKINKKAYNYILLMVVVTLVILFVAGTMVYYVDPFFHYHEPIEGFNYVIDNQLTQNPGMAEHMKYDSAILGSSMTVNFETDWFRELMDLNTLKLSYSSAYPKDIANILGKIYDGKGTDRHIKKIFLGLDIITYSGAVDETKYPLPEYLYDDNPVNDINYLLNKDVLLNYVLRPIADPEPMNLSHIYASWWTDDYYNEDWVLLNHDAVLTKKEDKLPEHAFDDPIKQNLEVNIIPFIESNPETEFVIFFPPYSILFFNDAMMNNHLEASLNAYRCVVNELGAYENVTMYFFPVMDHVIDDLNNYADYTHYHPSINRRMTECFVNGDCRIAKDKEMGKDIDEYISELEDIFENYDFDRLRNRLEEFHKK